jgi:hypothetical protein
MPAFKYGTEMMGFRKTTGHSHLEYLHGGIREKVDRLLHPQSE